MGSLHSTFVTPHARSKTVLIVEDDLPTRTMYREALAHASYNAIAVEDGLDALRRIEEARPDAVILDLILPRVGGWDVYKELRSHPATARIPVVIVTGSDVRDLEPAASRYFLRKPVSPETLCAVVDQAVRGRTATAGSGGE